MDFYYLVTWASEPRVIGTMYVYPDFVIKGYYGSTPPTILYGLTLDDELYTHDRFLRMGVATAILTAIENYAYELRDLMVEWAPKASGLGSN
jgi:GNAT superfamily N-acetyltransferase